MSYFLKQEFNYGPPGIAYKGGGGSTGQVDFPDHMEDVHKDWLGHVSGSVTAISTDLIAVMDAALASNPLNALSYDDFSTEITEVKSEYDAYNTAIDALDTSTDWGAIVDDAVSKAGASGILEELSIDNIINATKNGAAAAITNAVQGAVEALDDEVLLAAVEQYVRTREFDRARLRTRYKASMANLNAERSSAYALGLALLEIDFERETGQYQQQLEIETYRQGLTFYVEMFSREISARIQMHVQNKRSREEFLLQNINLQLQYKQFVYQLKQTLVQLLQEIHRISFVMDQEYTQATAELNWKHDSWDFEVFHNGVAVLGGIGGGQFVPNAPSRAGSAIGGALQGAGSGALAGASIGAAGGPITAAGGALIGGIMGLGAGLFS